MSELEETKQTDHPADAALAAATAAAAAVVSKKKKGPNFKAPEDLELCKAFVAASEDAVVGNNMRGLPFKKKVYSVCTQLITKCNQDFRTKCVTDRGEVSTFNRFKKISRCVLKFMGIESTTNKPSGDGDIELRFEAMCKELFVKRCKDDANLVESVYSCKLYLEDKQKWKSWQEREDEEDEKRKKKRQERPTGNKKAKRLEEDKKLVAKLLGTDEKEKEAQQKEKKKESNFVLKSVATSLQSAGGSIEALVKNMNAQMEKQNEIECQKMKEQTDIELMKLSSPGTKDRLLKAKVQARIRELQGKKPEAAKRQEEAKEEEEEDDDDDDEVAVVDTAHTKTPNGNGKNGGDDDDDSCDRMSSPDSNGNPDVLKHHING